MPDVVSVYRRFKVYVLNTSWIIGEKIITICAGFFVTILIARYLGPERYGILAYALSMTTLFASAGHMGLGGLVVREIVQDSDSRPEILGTSFWLKFLGYLLGIFILLIYMLITEDRSGPVFWVLLIVASSLFFKPFDVIDFWFQANLQAKYTALARSASLLVTAGVNVLLVFIGGEIFLFAFANLLQSILTACFLIIIFRITADIAISNWRVSLTKAKELLRQGWVIFFGAIFATIYLKIDQIMLKWFLGSEAVGIYSVASSLSEVWYFIPTAIVASFFPQLLKLKHTDPNIFDQRFQQIFDLLFVIALLIAFSMSFFAAPLIGVFFGQKYLASAPILSIHLWAALFIFMRAAFSKWILIENVLVFSLITQGFGALTNVGLNLLLIPKIGGCGAAIATLLSYAMASYFSLFFYKKSRPVFWMMSKAMMAPIRYPLMFMKMKLQ